MKVLITSAICLAFALTIALKSHVSIGAQHIPPLVVYCARDLEQARTILADFTKKTGINVSMIESDVPEQDLSDWLLKEKEKLHCDVVWNDDLLDTMLLGEKGLLQPYHSPGMQRMNEQYYDPHARWIGFSGRMRIWIINRERMNPTHEAVLDRFIGTDLSRFAIPRPVRGAALTYFGALWQQDGEMEVISWHERMREKRVRVVTDDATVMNLVARGECDFGWTDSDRYFIAKERGAPVEMIPIRIESETICIPNTVAILKGTKQQGAAEKLVDFLISAETELRLAQKPFYQIPLGELDDKHLPEDVRKLIAWSAEAIDLRRCLKSREPCRSWLRKEYPTSDATQTR